MRMKNWILQSSDFDLTYVMKKLKAELTQEQENL